MTATTRTHNHLVPKLTLDHLAKQSLDFKLVKSTSLANVDVSMLLHSLNLLLLHNQTNPIQFTFHFGSGKNLLIFAAFFINKIVKKDYSSLFI